MGGDNFILAGSPETSKESALQPRANAGVEVRLRPFSGPAVQVFRNEICNRVCSTEEARLVLIHAPAGFGKTTAMLQARARLEAQGVWTAWLTLDRVDINPEQFVADLSLAVRALDAYEEHRGNPIEIVDSLLTRPPPFALFIDCFELIEEDSILAFLRSIIERLPPGGRLVIASRTLPQLGIARLRGLGRLLEFGPDDMRLSLREAEQYFRLRSIASMTHETVRQLHEKTEGWITGLWLASLSIERQGPHGDFVTRLSGSTKSVADYLTEEVLAHQPESLRQFLLETSILRNLTVSLCQALVPNVNAAEVLQRLEDQNLFLDPVPGRDQTFRYHSLFADYLKKRLAVVSADRIAELHLAAARWFAANDSPIPAIDHAIDAGQFDIAITLLVPNAQLLLEQGRMRLLSRWFDAIPDADLAAHPLLEVTSVWATLFTHGPLTATKHLERLAGSTSQAGSASQDSRVAAHMDALRPLILAMQDRYQEARDVAHDSIAKLPTGNAFADSVLCNAMANIFANTGESSAAQDMIERARRTYGDSAFNHMYAESLSGMLDLHRARLKSATAKFRLALEASRAKSYRHTSGNAWAGILYASALYEIDKLDGADQLINLYLPLACDAALPDHMITGHAIRARIAFHRGEIDKAFEALSVLEHLGHRRGLPRLVASAKLERSVLYLLQGNGQASKEELDRAADPAIWGRLSAERLPAHETSDHWLASIRWEIHFGDARTVLAQLQHELDAAAREFRNLRALKLRALQCTALQRSGEPAAAIEAIATVLRQASREGFIRLLVDEGGELGRLVARFFASLEAMPAKHSDPVLIQYVAQLLGIFGPLASHDASAPDRLMEPLTQKEIRILQLVADGNSNAAIARKLAISDSTVRTHLRSINQKLNAKSRTEAAALGRRLDVVR